MIVCSRTYIASEDAKSADRVGIIITDPIISKLSISCISLCCLRLILLLLFGQTKTEYREYWGLVVSCFSVYKIDALTVMFHSATYASTCFYRQYHNRRPIRPPVVNVLISCFIQDLLSFDLTTRQKQSQVNNTDQAFALRLLTKNVNPPIKRAVKVEGSGTAFA